MKRITRRRFITQSAKAGMISIAASGTASIFLNACSNTKNMGSPGGNFRTGFNQQPLPYKYDALENVIDTATMDLHYNKHAAAYSKNLREAVQAEGVDMNKPVEDLLAKISSRSLKMRNNGGGHYNHELFWQCMRPKTTDNKPGGKLLVSIEKTFSSFANFKIQFSDAGKNRFGSGWAWLYANEDKNLKIGSTPNQDNPLMDTSDIKGFPLLGLDVWEHAYYLKYQNKRADYIDNWWNVVNWDYVQQRFDKM